MTDDFINNLISCQKNVINVERREMKEENRSFKNNIYLLSVDNKYKFRMFMRQSSSFIEDFSVGLMWLNANEYVNVKKEIILIRCQGPHDGKKEIGFDTHHSFHTHVFTTDDFESKRYEKPSNRNTNEKFSSFEEAIIYFINNCGIMGLENHINMQRFQFEQLSLD